MTKIIITYHTEEDQSISRLISFEEDSQEKAQTSMEFTYAVAHLAFIKSTMDEVVQRVENDDLDWLSAQIDGAEKAKAQQEKEND